MTAEERPPEMLYSDLTRHLMEADDKEFIYKLVGVILHVGTAEHGHYYSLINTKRGKEEHEEDK
jgi:ubiquitin C-terminal hydrolase